MESEIPEESHHKSNDPLPAFKVNRLGVGGFVGDLANIAKSKKFGSDDFTSKKLFEILAFLFR